MKATDLILVNEKKLTIRLAYHPHSGNFFVDFIESEGGQDKCLISLKISEGEANVLSGETGIKILHY